MSALTLAAVGLALACSGCLERQVKSRGAAGIVLDHATHLPVGGAKVAVSDFPWYDETNRTLSNVVAQIRKPTAATDSNGLFAIPDKYRWVISIPLGDYWPPSGTLLIQHTGYTTATFPVSGLIPTNMISADGRVQYFLNPQTQ